MSKEKVLYLGSFQSMRDDKSLFSEVELVHAEEPAKLLLFPRGTRFIYGHGYSDVAAEMAEERFVHYDIKKRMEK